MKKKMSNRDKTFWAVIIPVVILFFTFNTLPMIKGVIYSFTNYKGYGTYDYVGIRNYADLFTDSVWAKAICLRLNMHWQERTGKCAKSDHGSRIKRCHPF